MYEGMRLIRNYLEACAAVEGDEDFKKQYYYAYSAPDEDKLEDQSFAEEELLHYFGVGDG